MFKRLRYVGIWVGGQIELKSILVDSWYLFIGGLIALFLVAIPIDIIYYIDWSILTILSIAGIALILYLCAIIFNINYILKREYPDWGKPCKEKIVLMKVFNNQSFAHFEKKRIKQAMLLCRNLEGEKAYNAIYYIPIRKILIITELYELAAYCSLDASDRKKFINYLTEGISYFKIDSNLFYMRAIAYSLADQPEEAFADIQSAILNYNLYPSNRKYDIFSQKHNNKYENALAEYSGILNFKSKWGFSVGGQGLDYLKKLNAEQMYSN